MADTSSFSSDRSRSTTPTTSLPVTNSPSASTPPSAPSPSSDSTSLSATTPSPATSLPISSEISPTPFLSPATSTAPGTSTSILPDTSNDQAACNKIWNWILREERDPQSIPNMSDTACRPTTYCLPIEGEMSQSRLSLAEDMASTIEEVVFDLRAPEGPFRSYWKLCSEKARALIRGEPDSREIEKPRYNLFVPTSSSLPSLRRVTFLAGSLAWTTSLFGDRNIRGAKRDEPQLLPMEYAGLQDDNSRLSYSKLVHGHYTDPTLWLAHEALFQRWPITKVVKIVPYDEELSRAPPPSSITKLTNQADLSTILIPCSKRTRVDMTSLRDMRDIKPILNFNCKFGSWLDMLRYQKNQVTFIVPDELENDTTKSWNDHVKRESDWFQWPEEEVCEVLGRIKIISESDAKTQGSEVEGSDGWSSPTT